MNRRRRTEPVFFPSAGRRLICASLWLVLLLFISASAAASDKGQTSKNHGSGRFIPVVPGKVWHFPEDHYAHLNHRIEWWYFTGNLRSGNRLFGYELTFFRYGFDNPLILENPSVWALRDLYFAHFAVSDMTSKHFLYSEKVERGVLDKAGADAQEKRVWAGDWFLDLGDPWELHAQDEAKSVSLKLRPVKSPVFHGRQGYAPKGERPNQAFYYYSLTRLATEGTLRIDGETFPVQGLSWMDHEFGSHPLDTEDREGWDWFGLQLDDGSELMLYCLRPSESSGTGFGLGTLVYPDGTSTHLTMNEFRIEPLSFWKSPQSGGRYPVKWKLRIPSKSLYLEVTAAFNSQELITNRSTGVTYWEGAVEITGRRGDVPLNGRGYVEMTGYAAPFKMQGAR